jgi:RNA polymerase sigma factor (sigma-70 family)
VFGVCCRVLPIVQDAEDACQATCLVLVRKAKTGRWQSSIANWLYTTARRVASKASRAAARRTRRESCTVPPTPISALDQMTGREAFAALDEELDKLPTIYREPLVLCYLQGLTRDQAASRLGVPAATLKGHLDRGRKKLADALTTRGIGIGAGLMAVAATSSAGASSQRLVESILATVGGSPSATVAAIAKGIAMNGFTLKVKLLVFAAVAAAVTGFGLASNDHAERRGNSEAAQRHGETRSIQPH